MTQHAEWNVFDPPNGESQLRRDKTGKTKRSRLPLHDIRAHSEDVNTEGLRVRLSRVPGETPKHLLRAPLGLPAVLNEFTFDEEFSHTDYTTVRAGEFSAPVSGTGYHGRRLKTLSIDLCTLDWDAPWLAHKGYLPEDVHRTLEAIGHSKKPFKLAARVYQGEDAPFELRIEATLRRMSRSLRQDRDARWYTLDIVEWRDSKQRKRGHDPGHGSRHRLPTKVRLDADDTLYSLSKQFYGGHWHLYPELRKANGLGKWGPRTPVVQSKKFKEGDLFKIPDFPPTRFRVDDVSGRERAPEELVG